MDRQHQTLDQRSLHLHRLVAGKIRQNPALFEHVKTTLARWQQTVCPATQPWLSEWANAIEQGMDAALDLALEDSERATALRQSSPFTGILTHQERFTFLKTWQQRNAA
jgi:hypothetical protein